MMNTVSRLSWTFSLLFLLVACAPELSLEQCRWTKNGVIDDKNNVINDELLPYVEEFSASIFTIDNPFSIDFIDKLWDNPNIIGWCGSPPPVIRIQTAWWQGNVDNQLIRYALIVHELGHCVLQRDHDDNLLDDGCPESIMNSFLPSSECLVKHHLDYLTEMRYYHQ